MATEYQNKAPDWKNAGVEPEEQLKTQGFVGGYKPPAAYFNWFWHTCSMALSELQNKTKAYFDDNDQNIGEIMAMLQNGTGGGGEGVLKVDITSTDGINYTATSDGISSLDVGMMITVIPDVTSDTTVPRLNLNSLGAKYVMQRLSAGTDKTVQAKYKGWLVAGKPVTLIYDGVQWVTTYARASAEDLHGQVTKKASAVITANTWSEDEATGAKYQVVPVEGLTGAEDEVAEVDVVNVHGDDTNEKFGAYVEEQNQFLDFITNGDAKTVEGGIKFYIFGDANTVDIHIKVVVS